MGGLNAAAFRKKLEEFAELATAREALLYRRVYSHVRKSILDGDELTGAPGQPWETGALYFSWKDEGSFESHRIAFVSRLIYARIIEDNFRGAELRSEIGGFHSVKLTRSAWNRLVAFELAIVRRAITDVRSASGAMRDPMTGRFV